MPGKGPSSPRRGLLVRNADIGGGENAASFAYPPCAPDEAQGLHISTVAETSERIKVSLPVNGKPTEFDLTDQIKEACNSIVPPIVEGLGKLVATFDPEFQERLKNRVLLAGGGSQIKALDLAIELEMQKMLGGGKVIRIEEPMYGGANGALKIAHDMPPEYWEKLK